MKRYIVFLFLACTLYLLNACLKEDFNKAVDARVDFSVDTLKFDTVFAKVGSTTAYLTLRNPYDKSLELKSLYLGKGADSPYRININGVASNRLEGVQLGAKDSLYILVEITIDPNAESNPFVVEDSIVCQVNERFYDVKLRAWGQNAHYIDGNTNGVLKTQVWQADKPYLVYNSMLVDTLETLTIEAGTKIYMHRNAHIFVKGSLIINGTYEDPVVIQGDRLEEYYQDKAGQWGNIILLAGSKNNHFKWAEIKNGTIGVQMGSLSSPLSAQLRLDNCKIQNMNYADLFCLSADLEANNSLFADAAYYSFAALVGGKYQFNHCTFANYWSKNVRSDASFVLSNNFIQGGTKYQGHLEQADFTNCIIYGDLQSEMKFSKDEGVDFNYQFSHSLIRYKGDLEAGHYAKVIRNKKPLFFDPYNGLFSIQRKSPALNYGVLVPGTESEVSLNNRPHTGDEAPDIGAYEFYEEIIIP